MAAPLVPPDLDIPRLPWVPLYVDRLFESNFFAVATPAEFRAAFCLWIKSWSQKPPGSLPTDDRILCRLAELGSDLAQWKKVKRAALRHWERCDDGRLYHPVVAQLVIEAAEKLEKSRARTSVARANRWNHSNANESNNISHRPRNRTVDSRDTDKTENHPLNPLRDEGDQAFLKNGLKNGAERSSPRSPKDMGHFDGCICPNCARWAELQRSA